jgi:hypothetical protein
MDIGEEIVEQVAMVRPIPQVVVGIDNRQVGIEDRLGWLFRQLRVIRWVDPAEVCLLLRCAHGKVGAGRLG